MGKDRRIPVLRVTDSLQQGLTLYPAEQDHQAQLGDRRFRQETMFQVVESVKPEGLFNYRIIVRHADFRTDAQAAVTTTTAKEESFLVRRRRNAFIVGMQVWVFERPNGGFEITLLEEPPHELESFDFDPAQTTLQEEAYAASLDATEFYAKHPRRITRYITSLHRRDALTDRVTIRAVTYQSAQVCGKREVWVSAREERGLVRAGAFECGHVRLGYIGGRKYLYQ